MVVAATFSCRYDGEAALTFFFPACFNQPFWGVCPHGSRSRCGGPSVSPV